MIPNSLMEAMALGVPVISTDCPIDGSKMLIQDKYNGLLTPVGRCVEWVGEYPFEAAQSEVKENNCRYFDKKFSCRILTDLTVYTKIVP